MTWDGRERRQDGMERLSQIQEDLSDMKTDIALLLNKLESNHKSMRESVDRNFDRIEKHDRLLYGNGIVGLTTKIEGINELNNKFKAHNIQDRWMFGILISILISMLGIFVKSNVHL